MDLRDLAVLMVAVAPGFALASTAGCDGNSRFPICQTDADCTSVDGKPQVGSICYDLRCVQCANDTHCKVGEVCSLQTKECQSLGEGPKPEEEPVSKKPPPEPAEEGPGDWKECAEACKDEACIEACGKKFKEDDGGE